LGAAPVIVGGAAGVARAVALAVRSRTAERPIAWMGFIFSSPIIFKFPHISVRERGNFKRATHYGSTRNQRFPEQWLKMEI
jgi:hypothetical protein